ncbi:cobalamin biosynthesis protein [Ponticoccus sp. SC2-23]|uniref:adenosylcobinamide-phosphate synthase CbiB n=1 Tax=Alexandriicola marinus TaxID=2081710 RepID=UPI000FD78DC1|nr:adenosylcobinamide-phosphate synthase CbiB [Alexandriicola marinus]MBM1221955.1 cobalamin biosynthesis protein [Ponticoccus sp. SC6-9]MBM1226306.1 cobalamin biosynthesis protein [Ponticoccus sp. SC6-15]MBM1230902.1 cobalamin biosynthesis protein [Ponticoccus sp. SC6-38]MBM1235257.1 cobalamin biosynthesis protein [Ponticoccus sp. SC6-45]MBM1239924.1 cobalamin biosynthesis protein [Ponticoccus sp. SC6-49]MBM1244068.1 cobalamin biosynthesis protein [Ponticoccus sp. SC2-64]MBM1248781.1 cobala
MSGALVAALVLDAIFGEPRVLWDRFPHPAVIMGRIVGWLDRHLNRSRGQRMAGILTVLILVTGAALLGRALAALPGLTADVIVAAMLLAQRSLSDHVARVANGLRLSVPAGRAEVAMIVSRDTTEMEPPAIARSAIESAAENLSDGVIAPAFWFLLFGLPGLLIYKIVNTADSMIGYLTPRHAEFGWAAARLDDLLNLAPARLTALLIKLTAPRPVSWQDIAADARLHRSPNAGWPEAAMARALDISLAGPRSYNGVTRPFPYVHPHGRRDIGANEIEAAVARLWAAWALALAGIVAISLVAAAF